MVKAQLKPECVGCANSSTEDPDYRYIDPDITGMDRYIIDKDANSLGQSSDFIGIYSFSPGKQSDCTGKTHK